MSGLTPAAPWSYFERMAKPPREASNRLQSRVQKSRIATWVKVLAPVLLAVISGGVVETIRTESRLASIETQIRDMPNALSDKMDAKLANLRAELIEVFFSKAKKLSRADKLEDAAAALRLAIMLTKGSTDSRAPAAASFFRDAVAALNDIGGSATTLEALTDATYKARVALATYRSALQRPERSAFEETPLSAPIRPPIPRNATFVWHGAGYVFTPLESSQIHSSPTFSMENITFDCSKNTCSFRLDGWNLKDVTFVGVVIVYDGGPLVLDRARFVNCSFQVGHNPAAVELTTYLSLNLSQVSIG